MDAQRKYHHPAIIEAIIDIHVEPRRTVTLPDLEKTWKRIREEYSLKKNCLEGRGQFLMGENSQAFASAQSTQIGYAFTTPDGKQVFQARINGFSFSRLEPYTRWEECYEEAKRLWPIYLKSIKVGKITRLALRYINRFDIPGKIISVDKYFRTQPVISSDLPQLMDGFFMQTRLPLAEPQATVIINQTIVPPSKPEHISVMFDIDLFRTENIPQDDEGMWGTFGVLREWKNRVFEASITDSIREMIR